MNPFLPPPGGGKQPVPAHRDAGTGQAHESPALGQHGDRAVIHRDCEKYLVGTVALHGRRCDNCTLKLDRGSLQPTRAARETRLRRI